MKFTAILSFTLTSVLAQQAVILTRPNGEKSNIGPGPGCFGTVGLVKSLNVPAGQSVTLYTDYSCKGSVVYSGGSTTFGYNPDVKSIQISNSSYKRSLFKKLVHKALRH